MNASVAYSPPDALVVFAIATSIANRKIEFISSKSDTPLGRKMLVKSDEIY